jgi:hypothetical protein
MITLRSVPMELVKHVRNYLVKKTFGNAIFCGYFKTCPNFEAGGLL